MRRVLAIFYWLGISWCVNAQSDAADTLLQLREVEVLGESLLSRHLAATEYSPDSTLKAMLPGASLDRLLVLTAPLTIRVNDPFGGTATPRMRGASSDHLSVQWYGFPINSITLGTADLSQIPAGLVHRVTVRSGAGSSSFGSGTFGGVIDLEPGKDARTPFVSVQQSFGSFQNQGTTLEWGGNSGGWRWRWFGYQKSGQNGFAYSDRYERGNPTDTAFHNQLREKGYSLFVGRTLSNRWSVEAGSWVFEKRKNLAHGMGAFGGPATAEQWESSAKFFAGLRKEHSSWSWKWRSAFFHDWLNYRDRPGSSGTFAIDSRIRQFRWFNQWEARGSLRQRWNWDVTAHVSRIEGRSRNLTDEALEWRKWLAGHVVYEWRKWRIALGNRLQLTGDSNLFQLPMAELQYRNGQGLRIYTRLKRHFRLPDFNEKYWFQGGNPDLKPEYGNTFELGLEGEKEGRSSQLQYALMAYRSQIHRWIQWVPAGGFWQPRAVKKVGLYGVEGRVQPGVQWNGHRLTGTLTANWQRAINLEVRTGEEQTEGRQLIYTPEWQGGVVLHYRWKPLHLGVAGQFTGDQYTDENYDPRFSVLPAYQVWRMFGGYTLNRDLWSASVFFQVHNLMDHAYEPIRATPVPGRYYELSLQLTIKTK